MSLTRLSLDGLTNRSAMNLLGAGELFTTGKVFYVSSVLGSNGNKGEDPALPFASIDGAMSACSANRGDIIVVMPNHTETVTAAGGLDLDVAGVTTIGLGSGSNRPQINFTTATTADMDVDAADITMVNFLFTGGIDNLAGPIDVNADDFTLVGCEFRDVTGQAADVIVATGDRLTISDYKHTGATAAGGQSAIQLTGTDSAKITDFKIYGNFAAAGIESVTTANTNLEINSGFIQNYNSGDIALALQATDTGNVGPNLYIRLADNAANITECISVDNNCQIFDPIYVSNADGERGLQYNGTASADA